MATTAYWVQHIKEESILVEDKSQDAVDDSNIHI